MLRNTLLLALGAILSQSVIGDKCAYDAPYDLSATSTLKAVSNSSLSNAIYYIHPCGDVDKSLCTESNGDQQECFSYNDSEGKQQSYSLGAAKSAKWYADADEWSHGAVSYNSDILGGSTELLCNSKLAVNFTTLYTCSMGTDTVKVLQEPATSEDACEFLFQVDSSVVCEYQRSLVSSSSSSSTGESSSSKAESSSSSSAASSSAVSSSSAEVSSSSSVAPVSSSSARSSSSAVSSSAMSSSSAKPVSSSSALPASSSTGGWMSSSSSESPVLSSSSEPVIISSSSQPDVLSSSTGDDSSSTGADSAGMSTTEQLAIGLGAGLGALVLILLVALCVVVRKLQQATSGKTSLIDEESSSGRYNTLKNHEEGRGKKNNQRL